MALFSPITFNGVAPPWSLANLDANFASIATNLQLGESTTSSLGGTANAITVTVAGGGFTLVAGQYFVLVPGSSNSGATTIAVNGGAPVAVQNLGAALIGSELQSGLPTILYFNGTVFQLLNFPPAVVGGGAALASRRKNVNGGFDVWQRGGSFTPAASTVTYGCDQWWTIRSTTAAYTVSQQTGALGRYAYKLQRNAADATVNPLIVGHTIESQKCFTLAGKSCFLSFSVKQGANYSGGVISVSVQTGTGVDQGSASQVAASWTGWAQSLNTTQAITTTLTRYSFTVAIPAATREIGFIIQYTPTGTAGADDSITLEEVQFEPGSVTPFEDVDVALELTRCQRYYERVGPNAAASIYFAGYQVTTYLVAGTLKWLTQKRAIPAIAIVGSFTLTNCPQPTIADADVDGCAIYTTASATGAWSFYNSAGCFITVNAEL
jgi:hypothetical protein